MEKKPLEMRVREEAPPKPRRVYKTVAVAERGEGLFAVLLDGKPALTPARMLLVSTQRGLAEAVAAEWDAQDPHVDPETMPLTRLVATSRDRVGPQRRTVVESLLSHVDADVICYRASHPDDLRSRQAAAWQPISDWLLREYGIALKDVEGLMPSAQTPESAQRMKRVLDDLDDERLTAFQACGALTSSLALSFALVFRRLSASDVFKAAFLDELYQAEKWGDDPAASGRRDKIAADLAAIERYLDLLEA